MRLVKQALAAPGTHRALNAMAKLTERLPLNVVVQSLEDSLSVNVRWNLFSSQGSITMSVMEKNKSTQWASLSVSMNAVNPETSRKITLNSTMSLMEEDLEATPKEAKVLNKPSGKLPAT